VEGGGGSNVRLKLSEKDKRVREDRL